MRLLADENCDRLIVTLLRAAGHDVAYVVEGERGLDDDAVLLKAKAEGRAILTDDLDFGLLFERQRAPGPTVFLMRVGLLGRKARAERVLDVIDSCAEMPTGQLVVIEASQIRRRTFK